MSMRNMQLHIVYATDERYLLPTRVAASSAVHYASRPKDLVIDILDCDISDSSWEKFAHDMRRSLGNEFGLVRYKVDMSAYAKYKSWHTSRGIYARLSIPDILPEDVDWCVYADGDTLFVTDPFNLENIYTPDCSIMGHKDNPGMKQHAWYAKNGFSWDETTYFCAGFIMINLVWARKNGLPRKCFELIDRYPDIPFNDQDALNILCFNNKRLLPPGWGVFSSEAFWKEEAKCIHYVGERVWELPNLKPIYLPYTTCVWLRTARQIAKLDLHEIDGFSYRLLAWRYFQSMLMRVVFSIVVQIPQLRYRYNAARMRII